MYDNCGGDVRVVAYDDGDNGDVMMVIIMILEINRFWTVLWCVISGRVLVIDADTEQDTQTSNTVQAWPFAASNIDYKANKFQWDCTDTN